MKGVHPGVWLGLYVAIGVLPLAAMAVYGVENLVSARVLAIATGILALALLLMQFVSSGRYERLSGRAGIDRTMRFHQLAGWAVLLAVIAHPLLFVFPTDLETLAALPRRLTAMFRAPHLASGVIAFFVLLVLVAMAILRRRLPLRYELWRATHTFGAVFVASAGVHHALAAGTYAQERWLAAYWWLLLALALGTFAYLYLVKPFLLVQRAYRLVSNEEIGHGIRELVLLPAGEKRLAFEAGQFVWVLLDQPPLTLLDHPFSISSAPESAPEIRLLIKARGDFTGSLASLRPGARAYLDGPHGNFTLQGRRGEAIALIAGGIGIAPIIGLLRHLRLRRERRPIGIVYGARNPGQLVHADEIRAAAGELDLSAHFLVDEPPPDWQEGVGEFSAETVRRALRVAPDRCLCFVCGPTPMMLSVERHLIEAGVPWHNIVYERFDYD
jgi:predicted ferric reductase